MSELEGWGRIGNMSDTRMPCGERSLMHAPGIYGLVAEAVSHNETLML